MNQEILFFIKATFFFFLIGICSFGLFGQKTLQTESGQEIIILSDGTWKYSENFAGEKYPSADQNLEPEIMSVLVDSLKPESLTLDRMSKELQRIESRLLYNEAETATQLSLLNSNKSLLAEEIDLLEKGEAEDLNIDKNELEAELESLEHRQKILEMRYVIINNMLKECTRLKEKKSELLLDELRSLQIQSNAVDFDHSKLSTDNNTNETVTKEILDPMIQYQFEIELADPNLNPPKPECLLRFEGIDEVSEKYRKEVEIAHFFSYTHPKMRSYFKKGDFLNCEAFVSRYGGYNLLNIQVSISSTNAKTAYGSIDKGSFFVIWLLNGEKIFAINTTPDEGKLEPYTGNTIYRARYTIQDSELKELSKYEIDKVGILWSSGFEEYHVYNLDFFIHQINCLNQK